MPNIAVSVSEEEKEEYESRADLHGIPTSRWVRRCIRVATRLWDADGGFNRDTLDAWYEQIEGFELPESTSSTSQGRSPTTYEIHRLIVRELATAEPTQIDEIQELVTQEVVNSALYELQQEGEVEHVPGRGYKKL